MPLSVFDLIMAGTALGHGRDVGQAVGQRAHREAVVADEYIRRLPTSARTSRAAGTHRPAGASIALFDRPEQAMGRALSSSAVGRVPGYVDRHRTASYWR